MANIPTFIKTLPESHSLSTRVDNLKQTFWTQTIRPNKNIGPDLELDCLTLWWFSWKLFEKADFEKQTRHLTNKRVGKEFCTLVGGGGYSDISYIFKLEPSAFFLGVRILNFHIFFFFFFFFFFFAGGGGGGGFKFKNEYFWGMKI